MLASIGFKFFASYIVWCDFYSVDSQQCWGGKSKGSWKNSSQKVFRFDRKKIPIWTCVLSLSVCLISFNFGSIVSANTLKISLYAA